jgi:hypothetical protein
MTSWLVYLDRNRASLFAIVTKLTGGGGESICVVRETSYTRHQFRGSRPVGLCVSPADAAAAGMGTARVRRDLWPPGAVLQPFLALQQHRRIPGWESEGAASTIPLG